MRNLINFFIYPILKWLKEHKRFKRALNPSLFVSAGKCIPLNCELDIGQQPLTACVASVNGEKVKLSDGHNNLYLLLTIAWRFNLPTRNLQRDNYIKWK